MKYTARERSQIMPRPKIKEKDRRHSLTITVRQDTLKRAKQCGNSSRYFEQAVDGMIGITELMTDLIAGRGNREEILEEIEDIITLWGRMGNASIPFEQAMTMMRKKSRKRAS